MATITTEEPATTSSQQYYVPKYPLPEQIVASIEEQMANDELMDFMVNACSGHLFDTKEGSERRKKVIDKLSAMLRTWAIEVGKTKEVSDEHLQDGGGIQVQIFGSTKLEVHNIDSDIDMLCIAPSYVTRSDFFTSFKKMLLESTDVENLLAIPEAYTPVIKFIMDGQSVDMVFASLQAPTLPNPVDALDLRWLTGLDEQSVRSLNGVRVAEWICKLVPDLYSFRITLRVIKYWAKQRGLYSNILGFLGGVNYALLVALVCQTFPDLCPYSLVRKFFAMYTMWTWPTPVMLRRFEDLQFKDSDGRYLPVWNPLVNFKDSLHIMPIITPAYPAMNSAYNIAQPQFRCIMDEFVRAHVTFQSYPYATGFPWYKLFDSSTEEFFQKYPRYIQIDISAKNEEEHRIWFGWVESRIRMLILSLEQPPSIFCHPIANCFHRQPSDGNYVEEHELKDVPSKEDSARTTTHGEGSETSKHLEESMEEKRLPSTSEDPNQGVDHIYSTPKKPSNNGTASDMFISSFFIGISFRKDLMRADVSFAVKDFVQKVNVWTSKTENMGLDITSFDYSHVPSFVYSVKAEPSSVKSCTPKPLRQRRLSYSSGVPRLINGLVTYDISMERLESKGEHSGPISPSRTRAQSYFGAASPRMPYNNQHVNTRAHSFDYTDHARLPPNMPHANGYPEPLRFDPNRVIRDEHDLYQANAMPGSPIRIIPPAAPNTIVINPQDYMQAFNVSPRYSANSGNNGSNNYFDSNNGNNTGERRRNNHNNNNFQAYSQPPSYSSENSHGSYSGRSKSFSAQSSPRSNPSPGFRINQPLSVDSTSPHYHPQQQHNHIVHSTHTNIIDVTGKNVYVHPTHPIIPSGSILDTSVNSNTSADLNSAPMLMFGSISADQHLDDGRPVEESTLISSPKRTRKDLNATPTTDATSLKQRR